MNVELWMVSEFEHADEMKALRAILTQMVEHFADSKELYLVMANFFCEGDEIALAILKERAVIVVDQVDCRVDAPAETRV